MTWSDPIVDEIRQVRAAYAARFNYDLRAIYRDLKEQENRNGRKLVSYADETAETGPNEVLPSDELVLTIADTIQSRPAASATGR